MLLSQDLLRSFVTSWFIILYDIFASYLFINIIISFI